MKQLLSTIKKWQHRHNKESVPETIMSEVESFFTKFPDFRTYERCASELGLSIETTKLAYEQLRQDRRIGPNSLGINDLPQRHMLAYLNEKLSITSDSLILEVGPGCNPVFNKSDYRFLFSVDRYLSGQYGNMLGQPSVANAIATYSTIEECGELTRFIEQHGSFDLVFGSHSFEHEMRPIKALRSVRSVLKIGGAIALFVPDGFSNEDGLRDPSHTMYITPDMAYDLFEAAGGYVNIEVISWRPNWDQILIARRDS